VKLGLEDKKKATWAIALGAVALLAVAYEVLPMLMDSSTPSSSAQAAAPLPRVTARPGTKGAKKPRAENLDPTLRLDLLATIEQTQYHGNGRNIFVSQAEQVKIETAVAKANTDATAEPSYKPPDPPAPPPIPLKFYGFASRAGEPKRIFLSLDQDVFVAGEGEIVNRRYKVIHISPNSVEIQDMVYSGPPQTLPLSQG
jgi:hypothetical protein